MPLIAFDRFLTIQQVTFDSCNAFGTRMKSCLLSTYELNIVFLLNFFFRPFQFDCQMTQFAFAREHINRTLNKQIEFGANVCVRVGAVSNAKIALNYCNAARLRSHILWEWRVVIVSKLHEHYQPTRDSWLEAAIETKWNVVALTKALSQCATNVDCTGCFGYY